MGEKVASVEPSPALLSHPVIERRFNVVEGDFVEVVRAVDGNDRPNADAGGPQIDAEEGDAVLLARFPGRAHQTEDPVGVVGLAGPDLHAIDEVFVTPPLGPGAQAR
jgi:hypothetical protein